MSVLNRKKINHLFFSREGYLLFYLSCIYLSVDPTNYHLSGWESVYEMNIKSPCVDQFCARKSNILLIDITTRQEFSGNDVVKDRQKEKNKH